MSKYLKVCGIPILIAAFSVLGNVLSTWVFLLGDVCSVLLLYYLAYRNNLSFIGMALCGCLFLYLHYVAFVVLFMASERGLTHGDLFHIANHIVTFVPLAQIGLIGLGLALALATAVIREFAAGNKFSSGGRRSVRS